MRTKYEEMQEQLHALADWIEKTNNVHCDSVPRKAAYTIKKLEEENYQYYLLLNKKDVTIRERINKYIGYIKYKIYLWKKKT